MTQDIDGRELRRRVISLGVQFNTAAELLGLTIDGLQKQMRGARAVSQQTVLLLECRERERDARRGNQTPEHVYGGEEASVTATMPLPDATLIMQQTLQPGLLNSASGVIWRATCKIGSREYVAESDLGAVYELARRLIRAGVPDQLVTVLSEGLGRVVIKSLAWMATVTLIAVPGGPPKLIRYVEAPSRKRPVLELPTR
jgi:hypothetical protein